MENDEPKNLNDTEYTVDNNSSAVNKLILDYYKKFGRKRDIEQFFSLSTAQRDLSDPTSLFWKRMKEQNDSSDSGDKKSRSSTELCRISIECTMQDPRNSQGVKNTESDTESPPIISDEVNARCGNSDEELNRSDDDQSQKSIDITLDTSMNRPHSPTSSITSQRKLEWDSLADVGYANESDRKNSASSLSTLERLALHQQYSINDAKQSSDLGPPTAHSTPVEQTENKSYSRKDIYKKISKFCKKDVDIMEVNVPNTSDNIHQPINVNLTKHISFNVEKDGNIKMDQISKNISISQENIPVTTEAPPKLSTDKEIQTTLLKNNSEDKIVLIPQDYQHKPRLPVLINLNTLKKRNRKKRRTRKASRPRKKVGKENIPQDKSLNQESDAESFEYMPGHIYNQNKHPQMNVDNKSSLESSAGHTTESSKDLKCDFTKELEKSIDLLKLALQHRYKDTSLKKKLIKEVVQSLIKTKYKGDESSNEFLSELRSIQHTTSSTSDTNNLDNKKPKKSILRTEKFNSKTIASTSQSVPNLPTISYTDKPLMPISLSSTDSDLSYKSKYLSEVILANSSSEEIYKKYLMALKKENLYKKQLKEQELLLQQRFIRTDDVHNTANNIKTKSSINHLIKDLVRNSFDGGSGDASKVEGASNSNVYIEKNSEPRYKTHSVFTLSSTNTDSQKKNKKLKNRLENDVNSSLETSTSVKTHCRCFAYKRDKVAVIDSSVQVDLNNQTKILTPDRKRFQSNPPEEIIQKKSPTSSTNNKKECSHVDENPSEDIKYVCLCAEESQKIPQNFLIYKCSRLPHKCVMIDSNLQKNTDTNSNTNVCKDISRRENLTLSTQSSQTHFNLPKLLLRNSSEKSISSSSSECKISQNNDPARFSPLDKPLSYTREGTRCAQTEISIDPKISDPSISDIKMIDDESCVNLLKTQKTSVTESFIDSKKSKNNKNNELEDQILFVNDITDQESHRKSLHINKVPLQTSRRKNDGDTDILINSEDLRPQKNYTIPIEGTNITLKVSLKSDDNKGTQYSATGNKTSTTSITKDVETHKSDNVENIMATPCENFENNEIGNVNKLKNDKKLLEYDKIDDNAKAIGEENKIHTSHTDDTSSDRYCCTYPQNSASQKTFLRSDKDTWKIELFAPTSASSKRDVDTQYDLNIQRQTKTIPDTSQTCNNTCGRKYMTYPKEIVFKKPLLRSNTDLDMRVQARYSDELKNDENVLEYDQNDDKSIETNEGHNNIYTILSTSQTCDIVCDRKNSLYPNKSEVNKSVPLKKVQPGNVDELENDKNRLAYNQNNSSASVDRNKNNVDTVSKSTHTYDISSDKQCFTYPKTSVPHKPFLRSNTDSGRIGSFARPSYINKRDVDTQYDLIVQPPTQSRATATESHDISEMSSNSCNTKSNERSRSSAKDLSNSRPSTSNSNSKKNATKDPLIDVICDITKRYSKKDVAKGSRKKCYSEIISVLNYLLDTADSTDNDKAKHLSTSKEITSRRVDSNKVEEPKKSFQNKSIQLSPKKSKPNKCCAESSEFPSTTDPSTSTDSATCKILHKIKQECEKYHQRCCRSHRQCEASSSSSTCGCKRCSCRHKSHRIKTSEKPGKKCVAYNLILQTSDSIASEEHDNQIIGRQLKNIVVKVPSKRRVENMQFKEIVKKIEKDLPRDPHFIAKEYRSRSLPRDRDVSSTENVIRKTATCTIRDYLEQNRPDFIERSTNRQTCLKSINEARPDCDTHLNMIVVHPSQCVGNDMATMLCGGNLKNVGSQCNRCYGNTYCVQHGVTEVASERATKRDLLSVHVGRSAVALSETDLRHLAEETGKDLRTRKVAPKFINEKEMKKHSEKIYKSLPEVQRKKEEIKKERIKKTNLLMANIFKKNLQKKTLRGSVNLSNYSAVIKI